MASLNTLFYEDLSRGQKIFFDSSNNALTLSGVSLKLDGNLNYNILEKTNPPNSGSAKGEEGQFAYDKNHIYICVQGGEVGIANWIRSKLTNFQSFPVSSSALISAEQLAIPAPQYWWPLTGNGNSSLSIPYDFTKPNNTTNNVTFDNNNGVTTSNFSASLHNYFNPVLVAPSKNNTNFSISFQTIRSVDFVNNAYGFLFGNPFGDLGFHFEFVDQDHTTKGNFLSFSLATHAAQNGLFRQNNNWKRAISNTITPLNQSIFVVGVNEFQGKDNLGRDIGNIKLYINGAIQSITSYTSKIFSLYAQPRFYGASIGAISTYPGVVENQSNTKMKNLVFWNSTALTQEQITYIYNNGSVKNFPYN